jgi:hypothetical protein
MTLPTLTCDAFALAIDDDLDGTAPASMRSALAAHAASCPSCAALVHDVRVIRDAARGLEPLAPPPYVWARIESALAPARTTPLSAVEVRWSWREPLAAAAMLALVVSGLSWVGSRLHEQQARAPLTASGAATLDDFQVAEADYADAIASLEEVTAAADPQLVATVTGATLQTTLDDVDVVIGQARTALADLPGDPRSQEQLLDALGSKVALLQQTVALLDEMDSEEGLNQ